MKRDMEARSAQGLSFFQWHRHDADHAHAVEQVGHPNLPREQFDRLKAILHHCVLRGPSTQNRVDHPNWREHLQGRVAWAAQLNPAKARRLKGLLDQIDWSR